MNIRAIARTKIPNATLLLLLRAAKTVSAHPLAITSESVEAARAQLLAYIARIETELAARVRAKSCSTRMTSRRLTRSSRRPCARCSCSTPT